MNWDYRRQQFWRSATRYAGFGAAGCLLAGAATGAGTVVALGVCFAVLTITFGRRIR